MKANMKWFNSVEEQVAWYNDVGIHMSLDRDGAETPHEAFIRKMPLKGTVVDEGAVEVYRVDKK